MKTAEDWFNSQDGYRVHSEVEIRDESIKLIAAIQADAIESAAKVAESYEPHCESCPRGVANAILHLVKP